MKKHQLASLTACLLVVLICLTSLKTKAGETPVVLREWAAFAGNTDSAFVVPVLSDGDYTYSATYKAGLPNGVDIVLTKYDKDGHSVWQIFWTGSGVGRDQPSDMVMDEDFIYLSGITYSSANNYDFLTMQISKTNGSIGWEKTFNSSFSNYDVATSIGIFNNALYVTGVSYQQATLADYHTIKYNLSGDLIWQQDFDYGSLMDIPFDLSISEEDSTIVITGASQSSVTDWDYQTVIYDSTGAIVSQPRTSGSTAGFDRASAVKTDENGFIYITGATRGGNGDFDIKTVKLHPNGNLVWADTYDSGGDDIGNDLLVDKSGNVYICGESHGNDKDFFVRKYDSARNTLWTVSIDGDNYEDIAYKMCFDSDSNIIVTGKGFNPQTYNYDFLTVAFKPNGTEMWRDYFDGPDHGVDEARNIVADTSGNIFVTGQVEYSGEFPTVTIKYRTDFFNPPPTVDSPAVAYLFYPNEGQILDSQDSSITDSTHYYSIHHYPQLYFGYGVMNMVFSTTDLDTATADTTHRVDVSFLNSTNPTEAFPVNENDTSAFLNYYLSQCSNGIAHVNGNEKLLYADVYSGIDAMYTCNTSGLKFYFIINPYSSDPSEIGLKFDGQTGLTILNNWQLKLTTSLGSFEFEKPRIYQLDTSNNKISLSWNLDWTIQNGNEAKFSGWGSYDVNQPLIVEVSRSRSAYSPMPDNADWGTYLAGSNSEGIIDNTVDQDHNYYVCGVTSSLSFPGININVAQNTYGGGQTDAFVSMFDVSQNLIWSTFYGGSGNTQSAWWNTGEDYALGITATGNGTTLTVGATTCNDFPLPTTNPFPTSGFFENYYAGDADGFILELNDVGARVWATRYGGNTNDNLHAIIQPQSTDYFIIVGTTDQHVEDPLVVFPNPEHYIDRTTCDAFSGGAPGIFDVGLPLCNSGTGYFNSSSGTSYNWVQKGVIAKFDLNTKELLHATLFGGTGEAWIQDVGSFTVNAASALNDNMTGEAIVVLGRTTNTYISQTCTTTVNSEFPLCDNGGFYQNTIPNTSNELGFISQFDGDLNLNWSTLFGGCDEITPTHLAFNSEGDLYITGYVESADNILYTPQCEATNNCAFPLCHTSPMYFRDHYDQSGGVNIDVKKEVFLSRFDNARNMTWSTFYGGSDDDYNDYQLFFITDVNVDITVDASDRVYLFGTSYNSSSSASGDVDLVTPPAGIYMDDINTSTIYSKNEDALILSFDLDNVLQWTTYIGGEGKEIGSCIVADGNDYLYVAGLGQSPIVNPNHMTTGSDLVGSPYVQSVPGNAYLHGIIWRFDLLNFTIDVDSPNEVLSEIKLYPNPSNGLVWLDFGKIVYDKLNIEIFDLLGKNVFSKVVFGDSRFELNLNQLADAVYTVRISNDKRFNNLKFVLQR